MFNPESKSKVIRHSQRIVTYQTSFFKTVSVNYVHRYAVPVRTVPRKKFETSRYETNFTPNSNSVLKFLTKYSLC